MLKSKFPNLKISTSGKSGNGSRLTFTKAGTSNKGSESSKGNALSEKKKSSATSGAGAGAEGALSPTSFFRTAGTAAKGGDRKVKLLHLTFWRKIYALRTIIIERLCTYCYPCLCPHYVIFKQSVKFALSSTVTTETGGAAVLHLPPTPSKPHTEVEETEGEGDAPKKKPR